MAPPQNWHLGVLEDVVGAKCDGAGGLNTRVVILLGLVWRGDFDVCVQIRNFLGEKFKDLAAPFLKLIDKKACKT